MAKAVRLNKFLADAGKGTRSEVKKFIQKQSVQIRWRLYLFTDMKMYRMSITA